MRRVPLFLFTLVTAAAVSAAWQQAPSSGNDARRVAELVQQMTLDEKIGQMTQPDQQYVKDPADIETLFLGSLLNGGDSDPPTNSFADWRALYERLQERSLRTRLKIPLLWGVDAVHGHSNVQGAVIFPHNIGLGATRNAKLVEEIGRITAKEVKATGMNWAFGPCIAVPRDERWGRTYEGFSEDPQLVADLGTAAARGMQAGGLGNPLAVLACSKHFAGDGGTTWGTGMTADWTPAGKFPLDRGDTRGDEQTLRRLHIAPYVPAIRAGVGSIMVSYNSWNGEKMSGHRRLLTDVLKKELRFDGFLISDYDAIDELPGDFRSDVRDSVNAGMDMFMVPQKYREFISTLKSLVEAGDVPLTRIDDAVTRILRVKAAMGLLEPNWSPRADRALEASFGSADHRAVARQAVRESLVLLKNDGAALPIRRGVKRIHVAGRNANDLGAQCGGWTITWQGKRGATTRGTTILEGIREAAASNGVEVTFAADGSGAAGADVAIVVVGEDPYAEFSGDRADLSLADEDRRAVAAASQADVPVVTVIVSGRPMILGDALTQSAAVVAAWLPGTEGQGVADVLFGRFAPTGKLSYSWPKSNEQIPINVGDQNYEPLFPFGHGLTYR